MSQSKKIKFMSSGNFIEKQNAGRMMGAVAASLVAAGPFLGAGAALAESAPTPKAGALEEVLVVARRVEESSQSVPLAVTTLSGEALENQTIQSGTDLAGFVPSLSVQRGGLGAAPQFSLRGIRSGVANYWAEIPVTSDVIEMQLWDLSSVQAVAGPQGTLFGKNSTGGAILFVPKRPTSELEGYVRGTYGNFDYREIEAVANVPVSDELLLRFGVQSGDRDGYVENISGPDLDDLNRESYRLSISFIPADWIRNDTVLSYVESDEKLPVQVNQKGAVADAAIANPRSLMRLRYGPTGYANALNAQDLRGERSVDLPYPHFKDQHRFNLSNILTTDFDPFSIRYITGYTEVKARTLSSSSSIPLPIVIGGTDSASKELTQELQLIGSMLEDRLDYQTGLFYSRYETPLVKSNFINFGSPTLVITGPVNPLLARQSHNQRDEVSKGVYGQINYHATEKLTLTTGIRYSSDNQDDLTMQRRENNVCILPNIPTVDLASCVQNLESESSAVTYNVSVDYQINPELLIYAATRRGYNTGGHNLNTVGDDLEYDPEYITDYETGFKGKWLLSGIPVRANMAAYYSDYTDIQRRSVLSDPVPRSLITNAAAATLYGGQLELTVLPISGLLLNLTYGYVHSKYDEFENQVVGNATGNQFAQAPEHTASLFAAYSIDLPEGSLVASANYQYISSQFTDDNNVEFPEAEIPGHGVWGARLDWKNVLGSNADLAIFGKNLSDKLYRLNTSVSSTLGTVTNIYAPPRTYGVEMQYNF